MRQVHSGKPGCRSQSGNGVPRWNLRRRLRSASIALLVAGAIGSGPSGGRPAHAITPEQEKEAGMLSAECMRASTFGDKRGSWLCMKKRRAFSKKLFETHKEEVKRGELVKASKSLRKADVYYILKLRQYKSAGEWPDSLRNGMKIMRRARKNLEALGYKHTCNKEEVKKNSWGESLAADHAREEASKQLKYFEVVLNRDGWSFSMFYGCSVGPRLHLRKKTVSLREMDKALNKYRFRPSDPYGRLKKPRKLSKKQKDHVRAVIVRELVDKHYPDILLEE